MTLPFMAIPQSDATIVHFDAPKRKLLRLEANPRCRLLLANAHHIHVAGRSQGTPREICCMPITQRTIHHTATNMSQKTPTMRTQVNTPMNP
jgi:hypothetical protein